MSRVVTTGAERAFPQDVDWERMPKVAEDIRRKTRKIGVEADTAGISGGGREMHSGREERGGRRVRRGRIGERCGGESGDRRRDGRDWRPEAGRNGEMKTVVMMQIRRLREGSMRN